MTKRKSKSQIYVKEQQPNGRVVWVRFFAKPEQRKRLLKYGNVAIVDTQVDPAIYQPCIAVRPILYRDSQWKRQRVAPGTDILVDIKLHIMRIHNDDIYVSIDPKDYTCPDPKKIQRIRRAV